MMKHAILIMGNSNPAGVEFLVKQLDSENIDFYVHWDASSKVCLDEFLSPELMKHIRIVPAVKVSWGGSSQIKAQINLLRAAHNLGPYGYYHLVSDSDVAIMDITHFNNFFEANFGKEFIGFSVNDDSKFGWESRFKYYFPFENLNYSRNFKKIIEYIGVVIQKVFKVNRIKNFDLIIKKGASWYSITDKTVEYILNEDSIKCIARYFRYTSKADEIYMQTLVWNNSELRSKLNSGDEHQAALRYIDWNRGNPYTFTDSDLDEIRYIYNTDFVFLRKIKIENNNRIKNFLINKA